MNNTIDPCDDFYTYSCGTWHSINPAQYSGNINTDKFQMFTKGIEKKLNEFILKEKSGTGGVADKVKDFYTSCLNAKVDSAKYRESLTKIYKEFGDFSAFKTEEQLKETVFEWWSTVAKIQNKYGKSIILSVYFLDDSKNKSKTMAYIRPPEFELTQGAVNMVNILQQDGISKFLQLYLKMTPEDAAITAQNVMIIENNLSQGATDVREGKSVEELLTLYNTTDLFEKYQHLFDVKKYLEIVLGSKDLPDQIYIYDESYLQGLYDVFNTTDIEFVEDYILWIFLDEFLIDITFGDMKQECIGITKKYFGKFIDHALYNQYRSNESETEIYELWDDIKSTFRDNLQTNYYPWMSNATRQGAIKKLNNMHLTINSYDNENFIELFKNIDIDLSDYVLNVQNILEHAESLRENKLEKNTDIPFYNILDNQIEIPVALLQPRFIWDPLYPKAIQYGTLGYIIAHEMIHGFDDESSHYDVNDKAFNWWDEKSTYEFESRRKCFVDQYHNYTYDGKRLPKSDLQSENIADNGGINIAYDAYVRWLKKRKLTETDVETNDTLPRLPYNNRELFFISFAQLWCEDIHPMFRSSFANDDIHAPGKYRVIGPLSNSREFSWIFKCNKKNCNMNPPKKCKIY
ncbi:membrane metallo-endopeptidase-like 1 [Calliphora vicina]|uniref:membrane metallo-endopeptidase-like 1 n=1 Tax=Calliphora vicina TaxID=7373 RepID=UPI00325B0A64